MSSLFVKVVAIDEIKPHENADSLELAIVGGWQVIVKKGQFSSGDIAVHVPPDAVIPLEVSDRWGVTQYLSKQKVKAVRLRGEMSYGFLVENETGAALDDDLKEYYGIIKWEPPIEITGGDQEKQHPLFHIYTGIERYNNFANVLRVGEEVVATEKLHGTNSRIAMVIDNDERVIMVGSHRTAKKMGQNCLYELPYHLYTERFDHLFNTLMNNDPAVQAVIVFGEIYGFKVQDLQYGCTDKSYAAYDITVNGEYLDHDYVVRLLQEAGIPIVPIVYQGPFNTQLFQTISMGDTTLMNENAHVREGIVIKPLVERTDPKLGRVILKMINPDYETRKDGTEKH